MRLILPTIDKRCTQLYQTLNVRLILLIVSISYTWLPSIKCEAQFVDCRLICTWLLQVSSMELILSIVVRDVLNHTSCWAWGTVEDMFLIVPSIEHESRSANYRQKICLITPSVERETWFVDCRQKMHLTIGVEKETWSHYKTYGLLWWAQNAA